MRPAFLSAPLASNRRPDRGGARQPGNPNGTGPHPFRSQCRRRRSLLSGGGPAVAERCPSLCGRIRCETAAAVSAHGGRRSAVWDVPAGLQSARVRRRRPDRVRPLPLRSAFYGRACWRRRRYPLYLLDARRWRHVLLRRASHGAVHDLRRPDGPRRRVRTGPRAHCRPACLGSAFRRGGLHQTDCRLRGGAARSMADPPNSGPGAAGSACHVRRRLLRRAHGIRHLLSGNRPFGRHAKRGVRRRNPAGWR